MLRIVGATLVIALGGFRWRHTRCRMGIHKGRPYIDRFGTDAYISSLNYGPVGGGFKPPPTMLSKAL